ncbi:MAG: cob(I)yrinic acid a,c-diamide adenosyltransferase [Bacteroidales bacterium]|jgi:cob(I)alamin adenosyltransferase|nr:cob(I)yrinic acid a,c-diamide adenosyltransferase [Bacteroidales bacterium]
MKIYTKTGDKGTTSLIGGTRVAKNHPRLEAYGTVDELMAHTALLMDSINDADDKEFLLWTLERLMTLSSVLAAEGEMAKKLPSLLPEDVQRLEQKMDEMENGLEPLRSFVLPGGHPAVSQCHVARTVCRRTERLIVSVEENEDIPPIVNQYINRMSDYFFVLSRKIAKDLQISQKNWIPIV